LEVYRINIEIRAGFVLIFFPSVFNLAPPGHPARPPPLNWPPPLPKSMATGGGGAAGDGEFYLRYYVGHKGKFGHEFRPDGKLRYANNSNYKNDTMIRKEVFVERSS